MMLKYYWRRARSWLLVKFAYRNMVYVPFHQGRGDDVMNYNGWLPKSFETGEHLNIGIQKIMKDVNMARGWKEGADLFKRDVRMLEMMIVYYGRVKARKPHRRAANYSKAGGKLKLGC